MIRPIVRLSSAIVLLCSGAAFAQAQPDSLARGTLTVMGFVDVYYAYDFGHSTDDERPPFLFQYDRHNEVDLNLGLVHVGYAKQRMRAALGLMAGTYPQANLIAEPKLLRNIYEARVGLKLSKRKELWLDAGVFPSHIGLESAIGTDNWTLTRSVIAENSPYYLSGARLTWTVSKKLELAALMMNGWQRIRRVQNNTPCLGTQVVWSMRKGMKFNGTPLAEAMCPTAWATTACSTTSTGPGREASGACNWERTSGPRRKPGRIGARGAAWWASCAASWATTLLWWRARSISTTRIRSWCPRAHRTA